MQDLPNGALGRRDVLGGGVAAALATALPAPARPLLPVTGARGLDPVLQDLHRRTFDFFWETADPRLGLAPDAWPGGGPSSIAACGFALTAYCVGVHAGYAPRAEAARRALRMLRTFWDGKQGADRSGVIGYKGFLYHFLDPATAARFRECELSTVDTSIFLLGALSAAAFFDGADPTEAEVRRLGVAIYERVEWGFPSRKSGLISMGWHPERALRGADGLIDRSWDHFNEGMMVYLLALGSPTHPSVHGTWDAWAATIGKTWGSFEGQEYLGFSPLFGHQYTHCWYDFRGIADAFMRSKGIDYAVNSARATRAQRLYAVANPNGFADYGANVWGLTACQGPGPVDAKTAGRERHFGGYAARGVVTGDGESVDDGTVAPTAGASSIAFAPEICTALIHGLRARYGPEVYGRYGFLDAFNPSFPRDATPRRGTVQPRAGWVAGQYLGIDQGPILLMLENHRSGFVWNLFCRSPLSGPVARRGLIAAGFEPVQAAGAWLKGTQ